MEDKTFEELAKLVAAGVPRRTILKRAVGGALAGLFALRGGQTLAQPGCRKEGHSCEGNQTCCPGLVCQEAAGPGQAARCVKRNGTTTKKPDKTTTTTKKPNKTTTTTTTKKPNKTTTTTRKPNGPIACEGNQSPKPCNGKCWTCKGVASCPNAPQGVEVICVGKDAYCATGPEHTPVPNCKPTQCLAGTGGCQG